VHHASLERSGVAAVQQEYDASRPAARHPAVDELRRHPGRAQAPHARVGHREVEIAALVLDAVAREVDQQQIVGAAVGEEVLNGQVDLVGGSVEDGGHLEPADQGITQDACEGSRVGARSPQLAQPRGVVRVAGDDQRTPDFCAHDELPVSSLNSSEEPPFGASNTTSGRSSREGATGV